MKPKGVDAGFLAQLPNLPHDLALKHAGESVYREDFLIGPGLNGCSSRLVLGFEKRSSGCLYFLSLPHVCLCHQLFKCLPCNDVSLSAKGRDR